MAFLASRTLKPFTSAPASPGRRCSATVQCKAHASSSGQEASASQSVFGRRLLLGAGLGSALVAVPLQKASAAAAGGEDGPEGRQGEIRHTEAEWRKILGDDAYAVMRQAGTERRFTSPLNDEKRPGTFVCAGCGSPLFNMSAKYNSGTGWPSFYKALPGAVDETSDFSIFWMPRTEVRCHTCQGHLGHVFDDGPAPTGLRYCMNGVSLKFVPEGQA